MYNIRLLYDIEKWAYYWRCVALQKYAPKDFNVTIGSNYGAAFKETPHDLVLQLAFSYAKDLRTHMSRAGYKFPLISSYNVGWGYNNDWLDDTIKYSDGVIINSYDMWDKSGRPDKTLNISNGVDRSIFTVQKPIHDRPTRVLWCGSTFHRGTKNYDSILLPLRRKLQVAGIPTQFKLVNSGDRRRLSQQEMAKWYNTGTIYVCASSSEGTPNTALEAASCGCTVISTRVGNMTELIEDGVNGYLCDMNVKSIQKRILDCIARGDELQQNMQKTIDMWDYKNRSKEYYDYFRKMIEMSK